MKIYINSRGYRQAEDYNWHEIDNQGERGISKPAIIEQFSDLISSEDFSVLLAFSAQQLLLVITALQPPTFRVDFTKTRIIRNSIALVGDYSDERTFRSIAVSALRGELHQILEDMIEFGGSEGFRVKVNNPNELLNQLTSGITVGNSIPDQERIIQRLSPENQYKLAEELRNNRLPQEQVALVVVSPLVSNTDLENADVWRGLTPNFSSGRVIKKPQNPPKIEDLIDLLPQLMKIKNLAILIFVFVLMFILSQIGWPPKNPFSKNTQPPIEQTSQAKSEIIANITSPETQNITLQVNKSLTIEGNFAIPLSSKKKLPTMT